MKNFARMSALFAAVTIAVISCVAGGLLFSSLGVGDWIDLLRGSAPPQSQATLILQQVQALSQLTTTRYNYSVIVTTARDMPPLIAALYGESLSLVAVGHVNAGIDLSRLSPQNVVEREGVITITLPPPALQDCFLNEAASYVVQHNTGIFASASPQLDTEARRYAVEQLRRMALEEGILEETQAQARSVIVRLVRMFSGKAVEVITTPPDPNAPLPESCG